MFKQSFKYYKARKPPPKLDEVVDIHKCKSLVDVANRISVDCDLAFNGLIDSNKWEVFELINNPGLLYIKNPFTTEGSEYWITRCLKDFIQPPYKLNIDLQSLIPEGEEWWSYCRKHKDVTRKLRWSTLGYHHDWDTKVYNEEANSPFPEDLNHLCQHFAKVLGFSNYNAEAAIVNFYNLDSTLSGHTDHSEKYLEAPLFSCSFGNSAIFLIGGPTIDVKPTALMLRHGDVVVMSGDSRLAYHGVPRIIKSEFNCNNLEETFKDYLNTARININVRQVIK